MQDYSTTPSHILCCLCGVLIPSNPSNMCMDCIKTQVDITDGISKQNIIQWCKSCGRYLNPPNHWTFANSESPELLALCLKRVKGLNKIKLIDAGFVWTEPHSKRIKVKLTIQKEVFRGTILQQIFIIEFVVHSQMCDTCQKKEAKNTWSCIVQVRQKVNHKRTFLWLEQIILKHNVHSNCINVKDRPDGLDFYFNNRSHAIKLIEFLQNIVSIRYKTSEKLISQDDNNNTANMKHSFSVELIPICREDMICLPQKVASSSGNISPLVLCYKISTQLHIIDPFTLQTAVVNSQTFWTNPFRSLCGFHQLVEYTILDVSPLGPVNGKFVLAEVQVAKSSDFGRNDKIYTGNTHLGAILKPGDTALGYDLGSSNFNDDNLVDFIRKHQLPDFVLVRKTYPEKRKKRQPRHWKLKSLKKEVDDEKIDEEKEDRDRELFLRDVEEDEELQSQINIYKAQNAEIILSKNREELENEMTEEDFREIPLEKLMDDLKIEDEEEEEED